MIDSNNNPVVSGANLQSDTGGSFKDQSPANENIHTEVEKRPNVILCDFPENVIIFNDDGVKNGSKIEGGECGYDCESSVQDSLALRQVKPIIESRSPSPSTNGSDSDEDVISVNKTQRRDSVDIQRGVSFHDNTVPVPDKHPSVTQEDINIQQKIVSDLKAKVLRSKHILMTLNIKSLPDKGEKLLKHHEELTKKVALEEETLSRMIAYVSNHPATSPTSLGPEQQYLNCEDSQAEVAKATKTFEKTALVPHKQEKNLTLQQIRGWISTRPEEHQMETDPKGLKVGLMLHQKYALAWMLWREAGNPSGGILADDMGLGKTLTMISLLLKAKEEEKDSDYEDKEKKKYCSLKATKNACNRENGKYNGGTLVVCPASLLDQWSGEVQRRVEQNLLSLKVYHGPKRETKERNLAKYDMVVTTYAIVLNENGKDTPLFNVKWRRIVLDEAHQIRNHKSQTSQSVCNLSAKSRWALTGTPVHNKEQDLYGLLKYLRCSPFDDLTVWKKFQKDKQPGAQDRLNTVLSSLILRRTKSQLTEKGTLQCLPERNWALIEVTLNEQETMVYQKVLSFSRNLFANYLNQRTQENLKMSDKTQGRMAKTNKVQSHEILLLLLRLRQICCHLSLITKALESRELLENVDNDNQNQDVEVFNLLDQLKKMSLNDHQESIAGSLVDAKSESPKATLDIFNPSNPIFAETASSAKVKAVLDTLKNRVLSGEDKAIIVSQWTGFLKIIAENLKKEGICYQQLDGSVPVHKRMKMVDDFNDPTHKSRVLLLSLTAGGVGLNLTGANHLFLADLHWNPQLENQAQDRIYRVGQTKMVHVYKFMAVDTIEQQIKNLQKRKLELAENMLTGAKIPDAKLTLDDLKLLFNMT